MRRLLALLLFLLTAFSCSHHKTHPTESDYFDSETTDQNTGCDEHTTDRDGDVDNFLKDRDPVDDKDTASVDTQQNDNDTPAFDTDFLPIDRDTNLFDDDTNEDNDRIDDSDTDTDTDSNTDHDYDIDCNIDEDIQPDNDEEDTDSAFEEDSDTDSTDEDMYTEPFPCSGNRVCKENTSLPKAYCFESYCRGVGDAAWKITLYNITVDSSYYQTKYPGVELDKIAHKIKIKYTSSGGIESVTGGDDFITDDQLNDALITVLATATPSSYTIEFTERSPDGALFDPGWNIGTAVTYEEVGNGDFEVQLQTVDGTVFVSVHGEFLSYIEH